MSFYSAWSPRHLAPLLAATLFVTTPLTLHAQDAAGETPPSAPPTVNTGKLSLTAGVDILSTYLFRGIRQDDRGLIIWPAADVGMVLFEGSGALKSVGLNLGSWNSLHGGPTGSGGPSGKMWYESDFYSSLTFAMQGGVRAGATYTAYVSPNNSFGTVKEVAVSLALDDSGARLPLAPYAVMAIEIDGQADGGNGRGTYLELGVAPGFSTPEDGLAVSFPVKLGLSLKDYYEGPAGTGTFGYIEAGARAALPLTFVAPQFGTWAIRGGVSVLRSGASLRQINGGSRDRLVAQVGLGLLY